LIVTLEKTLTAKCPVGKKVIGGGGKAASLAPSLPRVAVMESRPDGEGWFVRVRAMHDSYPSEVLIEAWAICANVS
jgi:hypothetical protein